MNRDGIHPTVFRNPGDIDSLDTEGMVAEARELAKIHANIVVKIPMTTDGLKAVRTLTAEGIKTNVTLVFSALQALMAAKAGATYITFHPEASEHIDRTLQLIQGEGCKAGLVFNPATPLSYLEYVIDRIDMILLMSVNPGFGGQSFIPSALDKLKEVRKIIDDSGYDIRLEIDGGVKADNIGEIKAAGADTFVSGSGIFGGRNESDPNKYDTIIGQMREEMAKV